jgi:hypothetical protein
MVEGRIMDIVLHEAIIVTNHDFTLIRANNQFRSLVPSVAGEIV